MKKKKELDIEVLRTFRKIKERRALPSPAQRLRALRRQLVVSGYKGGLDLSSLIEECGEDFDCLRKHENGWAAYSNRTDFPGGNRIEVAGWPNPEEAVSRLLLALRYKE